MIHKILKGDPHQARAAYRRSKENTDSIQKLYHMLEALYFLLGGQK